MRCSRVAVGAGRFTAAVATVANVTNAVGSILCWLCTTGTCLPTLMQAAMFGASGCLLAAVDLGD